jgi:hypothetical protein
MTITISSQDLRSVKAIEIATRAGQWLKCRTGDGSKAYGGRVRASQGATTWSPRPVATAPTHGSTLDRPASTSSPSACMSSLCGPSSGRG